MPHLSRIAIYPLKSFAPLIVSETRVLPSGALQHDRQFALMDGVGKFINGKRTPLVHSLELRLDPSQRTLCARRRSEPDSITWNIDQQRDELQRWLSGYFSLDVQFIEERNGGFPDDTDASGPTIVSLATLKCVTEWFPGLSLDDVRLRFRANLEIDEAEPFWEDRLYETTSPAKRFRIGGVIFGGTNSCQRCVVPSRAPATGEVWPEFARHFADLRARHLPSWAAIDRFDHFYRLCTNTRLIERADATLCVGNAVGLVDEI